MRELPSDRYRLLGESAVVPKPGDIVGLDQGFSGKDGQPLSLVYAFDESGTEIYEAELYDSDFELLANE